MRKVSSGKVFNEKEKCYPHEKSEPNVKEAEHFFIPLYNNRPKKLLVVIISCNAMFN